MTNLAGTLVAGDSFKVFNAASYNGTFSSITPSPGAGLAWDATGLTNGTLRVKATTSTPPSLSGITLSGGSLVFKGHNNTGPGGTYHILTATNITVPLSNWLVLTNGTFDGSGNFSSTNPVGASARQFYILQVP